jgi:hypothetical protein
MTDRRPVWLDRARGTMDVDLVLDPAALPPPGPDGLVRLALPPLWLLGLTAEGQEAERGLVLMALFPPASAGAGGK